MGNKKTVITITANAKVAQKVMEEMQRRVEELVAELEHLDATTKEGRARIKQITKEVVAFNSAQKQSIPDVERVRKVIGDLANTSLSDLRRALVAAKRELSKTFQNDPQLKQRQKDVQTLQNQIDKLTGATKRHASSWKTALKNISAYVGVFAVFNKAKSLIEGAVKKNLEYSSSLTDIRKVSGLAMEDVNELSRRLSKIDTRTSVEGLAKLAYEGAKLGMSKYGVDGMEGFVRAADQINVAIGEEMGEQALPALSKMVEVMGLIPKMGIEKAMLATGSAMFKLSSTSTATSGNIVEFVKRCTGVARVAGITTDQLLALGSAFDSQMAAPEVASTAMSKFIVAMQKNHGAIEQSLDIPAGTINNLFSAGQAMDAIVLILEKMKAKGNMSMLGGVFKDIGGDGQRLISAMTTMAKNVDMLKDHLYESEEAFTEATAVTKEYEMQQTSALGILERANNLWEKAFVNPEGVDTTRQLAQAWYDLSQKVLDSPIYKGMLLGSFNLLINAFKVFLVLLPQIVNLFISVGLVRGISYMVQMGKAVWDLGRALVFAKAKQELFNLASSRNVYIAIATGVITLVTWIKSLIDAEEQAAEAAEEARRKANEWKKTLSEAAIETQTLTKKLSNYKTMLDESNLSQDEKRKLMDRFNKDFRSYITNLGIEIKTVKDLRGHYGELATEIQRATYYRMREEAKEQALPQYREERVSASNKMMNELKHLYEQFGDFGVTFKDIERWRSKGSSGAAIYRYILEKIPGNPARVGRGMEGSKVDGEGRFYMSNASGRKAYISNDNGVYTAYHNRNLLSGINWYVNSTKRLDTKEAEIDDAYANFVPKGYTPYVDDSPGSLAGGEDGNGGTGGSSTIDDPKDKWRKQLEDAKKTANGIIDNLTNFYERQKNEVLAQVIARGGDETEQDMYTAQIDKKAHAAKEQARYAIAGKPNSWDSVRGTLRGDLKEPTDGTGVNLSEVLLDDIMKVNITALHDQLAKLSGNLEKPLNSVLAEVFKNATQNAQERLKMEADQKNMRRKEALERNYTGLVQQNAYDDFNKLGYANADDWELRSQTFFDKRKDAIKDMFENARKEIASLYKIDPTTEGGQNELLEMLFKGGDQNFVGRRVKATLGESAEDWKVFYQKLIQYAEEYTEAEKKIYEEQKKLVEQRWANDQRNLLQQAKLRKMQNDGNLYGKRTNFGSNLGLNNVPDDPEIARLKLKMQMMEDYYAYAQTFAQNMQLLEEIDKRRQEARLAYVNQMASAMKERLSQMKELVQPVQDFGAAMGSALAQMKNDAEGANKAIKSALKSMLESWGNMLLNDVNTQMWRSINIAGAKKGKKKAEADISEAEKNAKAVDWGNASDLGTAGNPMHVFVVNGEGLTSVDANGNQTNAKLGGGDASNPNSGGATNAPAAASGGGAATGEHSRKSKRGGSATGGAMGAASTAGGAIANVATGNSSLAEAGANIASSGLSALANTEFKKGKKKADGDGSTVSDKASEKAQKKAERKAEKQRKKELKAEKKHQKQLAKATKDGVKDREKSVESGANAMTATTKENNSEQSRNTQITQDTMFNATDAALNATLTLKQKNNEAQAQSDGQRAQAEMTFSIAGAMGKCFEFLGPIAGPIAAAVVMSTLMGILQWALSSAFSSSDSSSSSSSSGPNTKLVSGMLTYDSGNVQDLKPFVGDDGEVYWASEQAQKASGVSLLTKPTATTVNGQPSLVAEKGPEIVIGRETTQAMMMNNPSLLKALVNYDANYSGRRAMYDNGNVSALGASATTSATDGLIANNAASNVALMQAINVLVARLNEPINASINMYGKGNLYESMNKANQFMKGKA